MAGQDPAALMTASFNAIAARDADALSATHHEQIVENFIVLGPIAGRANARAFFAELFAAAPDLEFTIERVMGVDDTTAVGQWRMKGTMTGGTFQGIEPTGRVLDIRGIDVMEFENGLLRNNTIYYDGLSFARQIGLLPPAGTRRDKAIMGGFNALTKLKRTLRRN
jgi:steroid delta-isomerase-like uncharacterized protein